MTRARNQMEKLKTLTYLVIGTCLFSCDKSPQQDIANGSISDTIVNSERQNYYDRIPDAPIDLYCYVDNLLETEERVNICGKVFYNNLTAELGITLKDNKLDTVELLTFYFDEGNILKRDTSGYVTLNKILNGIDKQQIPTFRFEEDGDYALRLQLERFCIGHVKFTDLSKAMDTVKEATK